MQGRLFCLYFFFLPLLPFMDINNDQTSVIAKFQWLLRFSPVSENIIVFRRVLSELVTSECYTSGVINM